uniref:helix-turn-helix domain-containing protein n=1 Tax=Escherichia coli TaxID=562 RepID=UPI001F1B78ED
KVALFFTIFLRRLFVYGYSLRNNRFVRNHRQTEETIPMGEIMDHFHLMHVFVAVGEEGGFAAAARRLDMSPPAVTRAIRVLEDN